MSRIPQQLTMGVIIGNRGFFPSYLVAEAREQAVALFSRLGINTIMLDPSQTELGGVETRQDAKICAELFRTHRDNIHGVVVLLPNFGDEKAIAETLRLSGLNVPVLIQAEEDNLDKMGLSTRRDSFCGKISLCNNLRQYGIPFTLTTQHVCALSGEVFEQDLRRFTQICRVVNSMRGVRVGAIGARPAGFNTVRYSEKLLERLGIAVETLDLSEVFTRIKALRDDDIRVDEKRRLLIDVMGALSMYALASSNLSPASIADWNNNFGDDRDKCVLFHCGNFASASLESPHMGTADIIGTTVGKENTCGAVHGRMKSGALTYFRLSTDDLTGEIKAYVGEGRSVDDPLDTVGCRAVIQVPHLENLLSWICRNGFEHHVAMNHSASAAILHEAFTRYLGVSTYLHQ